MKYRNITLSLFAAMLLLISSGCSLAAAEKRFDEVGDAVENRIDAVEEAVKDAVSDVVLPKPESSAAQPPATTESTVLLTEAEAEAIALQHAELTADQVTYLRTEYEIDDGCPQYEVQFHRDRWEYDYEIDAETGTILSFDKDD